MSPEIIEEMISQTPDVVDWEPPLPPTDLIFDDGEPLESNRHRIAMDTLIRSVEYYFSERKNYFVGGNMFIYYSSAQARNREFRGLDFFTVLNVDGAKERQDWIVWEEEGRYPDVIIELISPSTASIDTGIKKDIYEQVFRTPDYYVFDPFDANSLQGWHLDTNQTYQALQSNEQGWLWCQRLELWVGTWSGTLSREAAVWLRFYDMQGNLIPLVEEATQQKLDEIQQRLVTTEKTLETTQQRLITVEQQALKRGALRQLIRLLTARFGAISPEIEAKLQEFELNQLEELVEVSLTVNSLKQLTTQYLN